VEPDTLLQTMRSYFEGKQPPEVIENFGDQQPRALLKESLDLVEFVVYLEEELGREIDMDPLGEALMNKNFRELSVEVSRLMAEAG
jgi:acyl carrier protein